MIEMVLTKYSEKGARGVLEEEFRSRRAELERIVADFQGTLLGYWASDDGEWDTVTVMEFPDQVDAGGVAVNLRGQASGRPRPRRSNADRTRCVAGTNSILGAPADRPDAGHRRTTGASDDTG